MRKIIPFLLLLTLTACSPQKVANDAVDAVFSDTTRDAVHKVVDGTFDVMRSEEMQEAKDTVAETGKEIWSELKDAYNETGEKPAEGLNELIVSYIDVGQGDATLVTCGGDSLLIDAGDYAHGTAVQKFLMDAGVDKLDYAIFTHPDADHIGGSATIIYKMCDENTVLFQSSYTDKDTKAYEYMQQSIAEVMTDNSIPQGEFYLGDAKFWFVTPYYAEESMMPEWYLEDPNNTSLAIILEHGNNRFFFGGDLTEEMESHLVMNDVDVKADVYKVSHHGSNTSTSEAFIREVGPKYAVISCGMDNDYGHPHKKVLRRLRNYNIEVFRTDEQGSIICVSDGNTLQWSTEPSTTWKSGDFKQ